MDDFQGTYAPQSPDLSGYQSFDQSDSFDQSYQPPSQQPASHPSYHHQQNQQQSSNNNQPFDPFAPAPSSHPFQQPPAMSNIRKTKLSQEDEDFIPEPSAPKAGRQPKRQKIEEDVCDTPAPGEVEGVDVKTKFPVARIKRIMQADEDVGKVSQVTPTAVSKALELFIISLTLKSTAVARSRSSRRVTAPHLKQAVMADEQMDFLEQIVGKVADAPTTSKADGKKKSVPTEGEESSDEAYTEPKGKKKTVVTRRRRAKNQDDDD